MSPVRTIERLVVTAAPLLLAALLVGEVACAERPVGRQWCRQLVPRYVLPQEAPFEISWVARDQNGRARLYVGNVWLQSSYRVYAISETGEASSLVSFDTMLGERFIYPNGAAEAFGIAVVSDPLSYCEEFASLTIRDREGRVMASLGPEGYYLGLGGANDELVFAYDVCHNSGPTELRVLSYDGSIVNVVSTATQFLGLPHLLPSGGYVVWSAAEASGFWDSTVEAYAPDHLLDWRLTAYGCGLAAASDNGIAVLRCSAGMPEKQVEYRVYDRGMLLGAVVSRYQDYPTNVRAQLSPAGDGLLIASEVDGLSYYRIPDLERVWHRADSYYSDSMTHLSSGTEPLTLLCIAGNGREPDPRAGISLLGPDGKEILWRSASRPDLYVACNLSPTGDLLDYTEDGSTLTVMAIEPCPE
jgi:hypothetical protein